jgi:hypothetical protein
MIPPKPALLHQEDAPLLRKIFRIWSERYRDDPVGLEEFGRALGEAARARLEGRLQWQSLRNCGADENQNGALIEAGACLGNGRGRVFLVGGDAFSLRHHPKVRCFDTLEAAVAALLAGQHSERLRAGASVGGPELC